MKTNDFSGKTEISRIHVLPESVARRIAAGEVIDRPYSVVRELMDNAVDARADQIQVEIIAGGLDSIACTDNGIGMGAEDLKLSVLPHATSKIRDFDDIYRLDTLGFRGEALSSIAACSRLEILSSRRLSPEETPETEPAGGADKTGRTEGPARRIIVNAGRTIDLKEDRGSPGTRVQVNDLFFSLPGRRKFLKNPGTEGTLCYNAFLEKALPFESVNFRFFQDGKLKLFLPAASLKERVLDAYPRVLSPELVRFWESRRGNYSFRIVGSSPSLFRRDRKYIQIYVNNRRISEYALVQAAEYAYSRVLPGGCFPHVFLFIELPPDLVDFNIHPSKKEVRFRDLPGLRQALVEALQEGITSFFSRPEALSTLSARQGEFPQDFLSTAGIRENVNPAAKKNPWSRPAEKEERIFPSAAFRGNGGPWEESTSELKQRLAERPGTLGEMAGEDSGGFSPGRTMEPFRYLGQIFSLFLLAEKDDSLYLIDQHAAHERILYDKLRNAPGETQELLVSFVLEIDPQEEKWLRASLSELEKIGIGLRAVEAGRWELFSLPAACAGLEDEIVAILKQAKGDLRLLEKTLYARAACRLAVKDGDPLDRLSAEDLVAKTFALPEPRCPHGRPVWFQLSREELYRLVGRI